MMRVAFVTLVVAAAMIRSTSVSAVQGPGDLCSDPAVEIPFICGELVAVLDADAGISIDELLVRVAPEAVVTWRPDPNQVTGDPSYFRTYNLRVPIGTEVETRDRLLADPAVEAATVVHRGFVTPDGAMMPPEGPAAPMLIGAVLLLAAAGIAVLRRSRTKSVN